MTIQNNYFVNNYALDSGGAISLTCNTNKCNYIIEENIFADNQAD